MALVTFANGGVADAAVVRRLMDLEARGATLSPRADGAVAVAGVPLTEADRAWFAHGTRRRDARLVVRAPVSRQ